MHLEKMENSEILALSYQQDGASFKSNTKYCCIWLRNQNQSSY